MKTLLIIILAAILLSSCTMYSVEREYDPTTGYTRVEVKIKSTRDLEQPEVHYERQGNDAVFDFQAANVDNNTDAFVGMFSGMMGMMMDMMERMMTLQQPPVPE